MIQLTTNRNRPGPYDWRDFSRVNSAVMEIKDRLISAGYIVEGVSIPPIMWQRGGMIFAPDARRYLQNVEIIQSAAGIKTPGLPSSMQYLTFYGANGIEQALVDVDTALQNAEEAAMYSGEFFSGEV